MSNDFVPEHCIIALIGPQGAGKRTLITRVASLYGSELEVLPTTTTRNVSVHSTEKRFFASISGWHFKVRAFGGILLDVVEQDGERYGYDRTFIEGHLRTGHLIAPMRASSVVALRGLGYTVYTVRVVAQRRDGEPCFPTDRDPLVRACSFRADMTLVNVFDAQGLTMSAEHLAYLVTMWTGLETPRAFSALSL